MNVTRQFTCDFPAGPFSPEYDARASRHWLMPYSHNASCLRSGQGLETRDKISWRIYGACLQCIWSDSSSTKGQKGRAVGKNQASWYWCFRYSMAAEVGYREWRRKV